MLNKTIANNFLLVGLLIIAAFLCYHHTIEASFVFDDHLQIVENHRLKNIDYYLSLKRITSQRPFTDLTFALNYHFHGLDVRGFHIVNLLIHILAGITVFFLATFILRILLTKGESLPDSSNVIQIRFMAFVTALIFIVHPLQTQAVTYIVQRYTSMAALFYLLAVFFYVLARQRQIQGVSATRYILLFSLCLFSGVLAFLSKQSAASLPGALIFVELMLFGREGQAWKKKLQWILPVSGIFLLFVFYSTGVFSGRIDFGSLLEDVSSLMQETDTVSRIEYLYTQFTVIPEYIKLFLFPVGLNADPMRPFAQGFFDGFTPFGFLLLLLILFAGIISRKKYPVIIFAVFWFFITLSVESSIIPIRDAMFEHRMYLPLFGPALLCGWLLGLAWLKRPVTIIVLTLALTVALGILTYERNKSWHNGIALWTDVLKKNPDNFRAHTNLGLSLELTGQKDRALYHYNQALELNPEFAYAYLNIGSLLGKLGHDDQAEKHFRRAMEITPRNPKIISNLGVSLAKQGEFDEALKLFREAVRLDRFFIEARFNLVLTLVNLRKFDQARIELIEILSLEPDNMPAGNLLQRLDSR